MVKPDSIYPALSLAWCFVGRISGDVLEVNLKFSVSAGLLVKRCGRLEGCLVRGDLGDSFADGGWNFLYDDGISMHNILSTQKKPNAPDKSDCNCRRKNKCLLRGNCQATNSFTKSKYRRRTTHKTNSALEWPRRKSNNATETMENLFLMRDMKTTPNFPNI